MDREDIKKKENIADLIIDAERNQGIKMGEAFQNYEQGFDRIYSSLDEDNPYIWQKSEYRDTFELLEDLNILKGWHNGFYRVDAAEEELELIENMLDNYSKRGYDSFELITRYKAEAEELGKIPSSRDARKSDHMPSPNPYNSEFEKWANAKWRAGFEGHEKLGTDLLLEKLNDAIHQANRSKPIDEYEVPDRSEIDDLDLAPTERALRDDDEIGSYNNALEELGFLHLREDPNEFDEERYMEESRAGILMDDLNKFLENNPSLGTHFLNSENFEYLAELEKISESNSRNSVRAGNKQQGKFYKALEKLGLVDSWGSGPRYIVDGEPEEFRELDSQISKITGSDEVAPRDVDYTNMLRRAAGFKEDTPTIEEMAENPETPHGDSYFYHLGSYNNAVLRAGLEPNAEFRPESELEAALVDIYHILERRPTPSEVNKMTGISPSIFENRHEEGIEGMMDDLKIPTFEDELDQAFDVIFGDSESTSVTQS